MKIINIKSKAVFNIELFKISGEERLTCPECSPNRKKSNVKCFSWNHSKGVGYCSHCGETFGIYIERKKEYKRPKWKNNTNLSEKLVKWFESRGISQFTLRQMKITEGYEFMPQIGKEVNTVQFNYFRHGELVNVKYRDGAKNFKLSKDAELIVYNYDNCVDAKEIIIVEGEMDCLSMCEAGYYNCVSVPNGATEKTINLEYLDNCIELFIDKKIILATDNDNPGVNLRNELAARLGVENCMRVDFADCKDANEYLIKYGKTVLYECVSNAKEFPVEGVFCTDDFEDDIFLLHEHGLNPGMQTGLRTVDELISFEYGRLYTFTGIPGHGKSEIVDQICVSLNKRYGLRVGYFSPENYPLSLFVSKLIEKTVGKRFSSQTIGKSELQGYLNYMRANYYFIMPEENFTVESIMSRALYLVRNKGIKILVIDPYNTLEHKKQGSETEHEYVSRFLDVLRNFAKRNQIMIFLVAHPRKIQKIANGLYDVPNMYDISGSSNFYNKTDFGISVYRNFGSGLTELYVQKVKFKHLGKVGNCSLSWNSTNGRYSYFDGSNWIEDNRNYLGTTEPKIEINNTIDTTIEDEIPF